MPAPGVVESAPDRARMTSQMRALALVPWLLAGLSVAILVGAVAAWRRGWWDLPRRILLSAFVVCALLVVTFLVRWNYLPPAF